MNGASVVCRKVQVVQSLFLPFPLSVYPWREEPHHDIAQSGPHHDIVSVYPCGESDDVGLGRAADIEQTLGRDGVAVVGERKGSI